MFEKSLMVLVLVEFMNRILMFFLCVFCWSRLVNILVCVECLLMMMWEG